MSKPISQMSADEYKVFLQSDPEAAEREATGTPAQPAAVQSPQPIQQAAVYRNGQFVQGGQSVEVGQVVSRMKVGCSLYGK